MPKSYVVSSPRLRLPRTYAPRRETIAQIKRLGDIVENRVKRIKRWLFVRGVIDNGKEVR